jgi:hypothetical protein
MNAKSLGQAVAIWGETKSVRNTRLVNFLKTAFKIYILPSLGHEFVSQLSSSDFSTFCYEIDIIDLRIEEVIEIFDKAFDARVKAGNVSEQTKRNYRSALGKFFGWLQAQSWYIEQIEPPKPQIRPKKACQKRTPVRAYSENQFYGLKEEELTLEIQLDLKKCEEFWSQDSHTANLTSIALEQTVNTQSDRKTQRLKQVKEEVSQVACLTKPVFTKLSESTWSRKKAELLRFLGWCVNIEGHDIKELSLELLTRKSFYRDYIAWLIKERNCGTSVGLLVLEVSISIAKYQTFKESKTVDWSDIALVEFLRKESGLFRKLSKEEQVLGQREKWKNKEVSHQQAIEIANHLYQLCAPKTLVNTTKNGRKYQKKRKRRLSAIVGDWQTYLITKILVYAPVRQEEIRKLRIGSTLKLIEDSQGIVRYAVKIKEHKNAHISGKPRYYPLPQILTEDISTWINEIRPLAIDAPATLDSWLAFWDHSTKKISNLENSIQRAEAEETPDEKYCQSLRYKHRGIKNRLEAWETAKHNAKNCDHLFFSLGNTYPNKFCSSFEEMRSHSNLSVMITRAIGSATLTLFGKAKFLNPHGFRNIAAKHLRTIGRSEDKEAFSAFLGHSVEIDDDYADIITNDYDLIECVVDNWWVETL